MSHALAIVLSLLRLVFAAWVLYSVTWIVYFNRRRGFEPRALGWVVAAVAASAAACVSLVSILRLLGITLTPTVMITDIVATWISMLFLLAPIPGRWLGRARPTIRESIETANSLIELGKLAPANGERAFEKAFGLYSQAASAAPRSYAAAYGCGYALYELAQLDSSETNVNQLDRAQYWFKKAFALEPNEELRRFVAEIDEFRESIREA